MNLIESYCRHNYFLMGYNSYTQITETIRDLHDLCPPSKNGHKKASKNEMNRSISLIY